MTNSLLLLVHERANTLSSREQIFSQCSMPRSVLCEQGRAYHLPHSGASLPRKLTVGALYRLRYRRFSVKEQPERR